MLKSVRVETAEQTMLIRQYTNPELNAVNTQHEAFQPQGLSRPVCRSLVGLQDSCKVLNVLMEVAHVMDQQ